MTAITRPRTPRRMSFWTPLDNYEPTREQGTGTLTEWEWPDGSRSLSLTGMWEVRDARSAVYLVDDGNTVTPWYVAGWGGDGNEDRITLRTMPVNINPGGTPRMRSDRPEQVDYSNWALGPRRVFHLKVTGGVLDGFDADEYKTDAAAN